MSMMGEVKFFLRLQIKQCKDGIFINQKKHARDILKKFGMDGVKSSKTPMSSTIKLNKDESGKPVDEKRFRGMIGSFLYLTASMIAVARWTRCLEADHTDSGTAAALWTSVSGPVMRTAVARWTNIAGPVHYQHG